MTEADILVYAEALQDLGPTVLDAACRRVTAICEFFPTPANIRGLVDEAQTKGSELEDEGKWEKLLAWISKNFYPDFGVREGAPPLHPAVLHAANAAGGFRILERCSEEQLVWRKKTFLVDLRNVRETGQAQNLLGDGDAKRMLAKLHSGPPRPALVEKLPTKVLESRSGSR